MRMTRYWMTGSMALILLVAGRWPQRNEADDEREGQGERVTLISKYEMDETMRHIERNARKSGVPVLLRTAMAEPGDKAHHAAGADAQVLVLGDEDGRTPVWQSAEHATPYLPWRVMIRRLADGRAEVSLPDASQMPESGQLDERTLSRLSDLSNVIKRSIT